MNNIVILYQSSISYNKALVKFIKGVLQMRVNRFPNKFIHSLVDDISFKYKYINSDIFSHQKLELKNFCDEYLGNNVLRKLIFVCL